MHTLEKIVRPAAISLTAVQYCIFVHICTDLYGYALHFPTPYAPRADTSDSGLGAGGALKRGGRLPLPG